MKFIPGEACLTEHNFKISVLPKDKRKFTPRLKTWKVMDQESHGPATKFESAFMEKCGVDVVDSRNHSMEEIWSHLKSSLNSAAVKASGYSKKHQWQKANLVVGPHS